MVSFHGWARRSNACGGFKQQLVEQWMDALRGSELGRVW
jgi:hypothetical protein